MWSEGAHIETRDHQNYTHWSPKQSFQEEHDAHDAIAASLVSRK